MPATNCTPDSDVAMIDVSPTFTVLHSGPVSAAFKQQPVRSESIRPVGWECEVLVGAVCARLVSKNPPAMELRDIFSNPVFTGSYIACLNLTRQSSNAMAIGFQHTVPVANGLATFANISVSTVGTNYVLNGSIHGGVSCTGQRIASVVSNPFEVAYGAPAQLYISSQPQVGLVCVHILLHFEISFALLP